MPHVNAKYTNSYIINVNTLSPTQHYENMAMQYTEIFLALKIEIFQLNNFDSFLIFAQNIDCGYTLEPPRRGGSNEYTQSVFWSKNKKNRYTSAYQLYYIKVGFEGVYFTRTCFPDELPFSSFS